jgi:hypothetical protein
MARVWTLMISGKALLIERDLPTSALFVVKSVRLAALVDHLVNHLKGLMAGSGLTEG